MDSFEKHGLDNDTFGEKSSGGFQSFDAFPKTKPSYTSATSAGGKWTVVITVFCILLTLTEIRTWVSGVETHHFSVEQGIGHELQLNFDIVVAMPCQDLAVNVQDASMDRILAGDLLKKEDTNYQTWVDGAPTAKAKGYRNVPGEKGYRRLHESDLRRRRAEEEDQHVSHVLGHMRENPTRKFVRSPKLRTSAPKDACRIYGSLEGNKVQGDFHITARGHGYHDFGEHLNHGTFNFSHHINELSFGPHYPNLLNPLDKTSESTEANFYKYQYYLSIVPTIFTRRSVTNHAGTLDPASIPQPPTLDMSPLLSTAKRQIKDKLAKQYANHRTDTGQQVIANEPVRHISNPALKSADSNSIFTNQYAATSQSHPVSANVIPGVFFKYDIEPILLIVSERRTGFLGMVVKVVNVVAGVLVGGGWTYQIWMWVGEVVGGRWRGRNRSMNGSILHS